MPTLTTQQNFSTDIYPGGTVPLLVVFEDHVGTDQGSPASGVTITISESGAPDSGSGTPVPTTSSGILSQGNGRFEFTWNCPAATVPGSYLVTWSGTRSSDGTVIEYTQLCMVAAQPAPVPAPGVYATVAQYRAWSGDTITPQQILTVKLHRASEDIDVALVGAVYRVDADGMPLDAGLANVLARATSAQCQYLLATNDDAGVKREYSSVSAAGVSVTRAQGLQGRAMPPVAPRALSILRVAGVLPGAPLVNW